MWEIITFAIIAGVSYYLVRKINFRDMEDTLVQEKEAQPVEKQFLSSYRRLAGRDPFRASGVTGFHHFNWRSDASK